MQPTKIDNAIDNTIKQLVGYKYGARPWTAFTRTARQLGYRGALGLNLGSALRNLTQGANTYAKLGEKYTAIGYMNLVKNGSKELHDVGVLRNDFIQDRSMNATRKFWEKTDKGLFFFFETAEMINRGAAYYGAKAQAIAKGMNEQQAIEYGKKVVRDTQFTFGQVDTPAILGSDIGKTLGQFQTYNLKQAEFLGEMIKAKDVMGLMRYSIAATAMVYTVGKLFGADMKDIIPFSGVLTGETKLGQTPAIGATMGVIDAVTKDKDKYGNELTPGERVENAAKGFIPVIPGGVQAKKTIEGLGAAMKGYSESRSGRVQYPIEQSTTNLIRAGLFGKNNLPEAQEYFDKERTVLGEKQSQMLKESSDRKSLYDTFIQKRESDNTIEDQKAQVEASGKGFVSRESVVYLDPDSQEIRTINLAPKGTSGKQGIDAFKEDTDNNSKARQIWSIPNDQVSLEEKEQLFNQLGVTSEQVRYDYMTSFNNDEKTNYILSKQMDHNTLLQRLITGRQQSVSGKIFASDGVIDSLRDAGKISYNEAKALKALDFDINGKRIVKARSGGRKAKIKMVSLKDATKPFKFKTKPLKLAKIKLGSKSKKYKKVQGLQVKNPTV